MKKCIYAVVTLLNINNFLISSVTTFSFDTAQKNQSLDAMSKQQMLNTLKHQIQHLQGYSDKDAQEQIDSLQQKPLSEIKDFFIHFQQRFTKGNTSSQTNEQQHRLEQMHSNYNNLIQEKSFLSKIPVIKNTMTAISNAWSESNDEKIFDAIKQAMQQAGISEYDIAQEIEQLKNSSLPQLQEQYSSASNQLAKRLYYFNANPQTASPTIKNVDTMLQLLHTWGTTATMLASHIAQLYGYDTTMLNNFTNFSLFDPNLTLSNTTTKNDMLRMICAQYASFDQLKDTYLDPEYQEEKLLTKQELLEKISQHLTELQMPKPQYQKLMKSYESISKSELQDTALQLEHLSKEIQQHPPTKLESTIINQTKSSLINSIKVALITKKYPKKTIAHEIEKLNKQPVEYARMLFFDLKTIPEQFKSGKPIRPITNATLTLESYVNKLPSIVVKPVFAMTKDHIQKNIQQEKKSYWYSEWKIKHLQHSIRPNFLDHATTKIAHLASAASLASSIIGAVHSV